MLIAGASLAGEAARPQRRIDLGDGGSAGRNVPAVEGPEMDARPKPLPDEAQPWNASMGGLGHAALHVEMKHRFGAAGARLGQAPPAGTAGARRAGADRPIADEIDVGVVLVGRPMALEVVEERRPIGKQPMPLEITQREGKAVVDADQGGEIFGEPLNQPFGDPASCPVFARAGRRWNFSRQRIGVGQIDAQALEAGGRGFRTRVVDTDETGESGRVSLHTKDACVPLGVAFVPILEKRRALLREHRAVVGCGSRVACSGITPTPGTDSLQKRQTTPTQRHSCAAQESRGS